MRACALMWIFECVRVRACVRACVREFVGAGCGVWGAGALSENAECVLRVSVRRVRGVRARVRA